MPQITSPLSTPTGMPALNSAHLGKAAGLRIHFALFSDFTAAITTGTSSYAADLWADGQEMTIASEADSGAVRVWRTALGHARTVKVGRLEVVLPANSNVVLAAAGVPVSGTGANGDLSVDKAAGIAYLKTAGAWASAGNISSLSSATAAAVEAAKAAGSNFMSGTLGPVADLPTLNSTYPAAVYKGATALAGPAAPYPRYESTGSAWVKKVYASALKELGSSMSSSRLISSAVAGTAGTTYAFCEAVPGGYKGVRLCVSNRNTAEPLTVTMKVAPTASLLNNGGALTYTAVTWGGATSVVIPPATLHPVSGQTVDSFAYSDIIGIQSVATGDGGADPYLYFRFYSPELSYVANVNPTLGLIPASGLKFAAASVAADNITTPTAMTASSTTYLRPLVQIDYVKSAKAVRIEMAGDSLSAGVDPTSNFPLAAQPLFAAAGRSDVSIACWGITGQKRDTSSAILQARLALTRPDIAIFWDFSVNSAVTDAVAFGWLLADIEFCRRNGITPVVITMHRGAGGTTTRNDLARAMCADRGILLLDLAKVLALDPNNPTTLNPIYAYNPGVDDTHLNSLGYQTFAAYAVPLLLSLIQ